MKKFLQEFKDFAMRGSVIDLAVGVIIGGAFQKIVNSLVKDILSPILGLFAKNSFDDLSISFMGVTVRYGSFITEVINFIIMAFVIFLLVKALNSLAKLHGHTEDDDPTTKQCPFCMSEIDINATLRGRERISSSVESRILPRAITPLPSRQHGTTVPSHRIAICWRSP